MDEGLEQAYVRHARAGRAVRAGLRQMGVGVFAQEAMAAPISTRLVFGPPLDWTVLSGHMLNKKGISLASGSRIGIMGQNANPEPVLRTLSALEETLRELGYPVMPGGVEAGGNVYDQSGAIP